MATLETTPKLYVRCLFRPDAHNRVTNPGFETNTTGWSVSAGVNGTGTSITRITTDAHTGSACGSLVTGIGTDAGVNFDLGSTRYWDESRYGTTYVAVAWLKRASGGRRVRMILGSEGTSTDRATFDIDDLTDAWAPYRVVWCPESSRTDVQLAIVGQGYFDTTILIDDVAVYQLDAFSQVENSNFANDTTGWSVSASINAAGTSLTRGTSGGFAVSTDATLVTTSTSGSGCNFQMPGRTFVSGRTYRARVGLRHASSANVRLRLGSLGTGADRGDKTVAVTSAYEWYFVDWTPSGDRTDVELAITNASAAILTVRITSVEVFEAIDELNSPDAGRADVRDLSWGRSLASVGTMSATLNDPVDTHRYTPWYTSGALYGLLRTGRRLWARASYNNLLWGLAFGTVRRWVPDLNAGTCQVLAEDPMRDLGAARITVGFAASRSYRSARATLFGSSAAASGNIPIAGDARTNLADTNTEQATFYDGTNGEVSALDYLNALNDATGTAHFVEPSGAAEYLWLYSTVARATLADAAASSTSVTEDDFADLRDMDLSDATVETVQSVGWQAYERIATVYTEQDTYETLLVQAFDRGADTTPLGVALDDDDPYLHFIDDRLGTDEDVPEPTYEREVVWKRVRRRKSRKKVRVRTIRYRRVYADPFRVASGVETTFDLTFSVPVSISSDQVFPLTWDFAPPDLAIDGNATVDVIQASPRDVRVRIISDSPDGVIAIYIRGNAWLPRAEETVTLVNHAGIIDYDVRPGPVSNTPYVPSLGGAQGMASYRQWRYGEPRLRPTLVNEHKYDNMRVLELTDHVSVTAAKFALSSAVFLVDSISGQVAGGGLRWSVSYRLEALPTSIGTLFTLGTSSLGGAHVMSY